MIKEMPGQNIVNTCDQSFGTRPGIFLHFYEVPFQKVNWTLDAVVKLKNASDIVFLPPEQCFTVRQEGNKKEVIAGH